MIENAVPLSLIFEYSRRPILLPNVVLVSIDDLFSINAWPELADLVKTPHLDAFAAQSNNFINAFAHVALCNPSRSSILSGRDSWDTGIVDNAVPIFERVAVEDVLFSRLDAGGYDVVMGGKVFHRPYYPEMDQFVSRFLDWSGFSNGTVPGGSNVAGVAYGSSGDLTLADTVLTEQVVGFLQESHTNPFALAAGIYRPHIDWIVPQEFFDLYDPNDITVPYFGDDTAGMADFYYAMTGSAFHGLVLDNDAWVELIHAYLASVSYADSLFGKMIGALDASPYADNTDVVLFSDHGYHLGDRGLWSKFTLWEESGRAPLMIREAGQTEGRVVGTVVSLSDIYPTVLDLAGVEGGFRGSGNTLLPLMEGGDPSQYAGDGAFTWVYGDYSYRTDEFRYIRYADGKEEFYNILADPHQLSNLVDDPDSQVQLDEHRAAVPDLDKLTLFLGSSADDSLTGTAGDDLFILGGGRDTASGGSGNDKYFVQSPAEIIEAEDGGTDTIVSSLAVTVAPANVENIQLIFQIGIPTTLFGNELANAIFTGVGRSTVYAGDGNDSVVSLSGADTLFGGAGDDRMLAGGSNDFLYGGDGDDHLEGERGDDFLSGGTGNDTLIGGLGNDELYGAVGDDLLHGNHGNDFLDGGSGHDLLDGGHGDDRLHGGVGDDLIYGGPGHDYLHGGIDNDTLYGGSHDDTLRGGDGDDNLFGNSGDDNLNGGRGADRLDGGIGNDFLLGWDGNDYLEGGAGRDHLDGGNGSDNIFGGGGNDLIYGGNGHDAVKGGSGDDRIFGDAGRDFLVGEGGNDQIFGGLDDDILRGLTGNDKLWGEQGDDQLFGGEGNDHLDGGSGQDIMRGGIGDDSYVVDDPDDVVIELAKEGVDSVLSTVDYTLGAHIENLRLAGSAAVGTGNALANRIFAGIAGATLSGLDGDDTIYGSNTADSIYGGNGADRLVGNAGEDTIHGGQGDDIINGGSNIDTLHGDGGNDLILGGVGNDVLYGGTGNDTLRGGANMDTLHGEDGADILDGGDGVDLLIGGANRDVMTGGLRADVFAFDDGDFAGLAANTADRIKDFNRLEGDNIDLSAVDAILGGADDAFDYIGSDAFSGTAGELRWEHVGSNTMIFMDVDGDALADYAIRLDGTINLAESAFIL
ncbi:MAG: sulfatase-like hydrolase/transferase [Erythrobacter sp.]|nr:MAG: sulfatase-like hydrolase/transferase [Erythrobacter sp.]